MSAQDIQPVTILIPHYQTLDSIRLCLRSIRKYTPLESVKVQVLDNGSTGASMDYLHSLSWIDLVHTDCANHIWKAHYMALNQAVSDVNTPYLLLLHSDTYVHHPDWLGVLFRQITGRTVAVGPRHQRIPIRTPLWSLSAVLQSLRSRELKPGVPTLRSFCALYQADILQKLGCEFVTEAGEDINVATNEELVENGYSIKGLSAWHLSKYLFHASAITLIAQGTEPVQRRNTAEACQTGQGYVDCRTYRRTRQMLDRFMALPATQAILSDNSLDA